MMGHKEDCRVNARTGDGIGLDWWWWCRGRINIKKNICLIKTKRWGISNKSPGSIRLVGIVEINTVSYLF
jgi:hypothetical protein